MQFTITCQSGLESLVRRECEKIGLTNIRGQDRMMSGIGDAEKMYNLLLWSRFANRIYLNLREEKVTDFDRLYEIIRSIEWQSYLNPKLKVVVDASSARSSLSNTPTLQSIGERAIYDNLGKSNATRDTEMHILILIVDDIVRILLDITGDPLHKRGYRQDAGEAPLKENLSAALVAFSGWRYREPLIDPFCGSGTITIEAAMIARNIAPGLSRSFRIEDLPFHDAAILESAVTEARKKIYPSGAYKITASDRDGEILDVARANARKAGVAEDIIFETGDFLSVGSLPTGTIVTNPPYGKRLTGKDVEAINAKLVEAVSQNGGGFITSAHMKCTMNLSNKKLLNGSEECRFWYKRT